MSRVSRAVQADRGERSFSSQFPWSFNFFSLRQEVSGERTITEGMSAMKLFVQVKSSRRGIEMSVTEESPIHKLLNNEQAANGERSVR
jgi:hypothetical protein